METAAELLEHLDRLRRNPRGEHVLASGVGIHEAAVGQGLAGPNTEGRVARWVGELVADHLLGFRSTSSGVRPLPTGAPWNWAEIQIHHYYFVTPAGSQDAGETRRLRARERVLADLVPERALAALSDEGIAALEEPAGTLAHALTEGHRVAAIGSAKELVESTCRVILTDRGMPPSSNEGLPVLVKRAMPEHRPPSRWAMDLARRLAGVADALAGLRNEAGSGHGRAQPSPATAADAQLAAGTAATLVRYLLSSREA